MSTTTERLAQPERRPEGAARVAEPAPKQANGAVATAERPAAQAVSAERERSAVPSPASVEPLSEIRPKRRRLVWLAPVLGLVGLVAIIVGYRYWYESTYFVITDNAQVTGDLVQIGSLNSGRIMATRVEVGDQVKKDQELAWVAVPQQVGAVPNSATLRMDLTGSSDAQVAVRSPFSGVVVARMGFVGGTVTAGQPIYALVDPGQIWIRANVEETKVGRVQAGQGVDVHVDALDRDFSGRVLAVTPASAATFSLLPSQNASGNFVKVTQLVPVKISVDSGDAVLPLGTSVSVRIRVRESRGGVPWQP